MLSVAISLNVRRMSVAGSISLFLLAGCASHAGLQPEARLLTAEQLQGAAVSAVAQPTNDWPHEDWWRAYGDPVLDALITQALAGNPDLQGVAARVRQATALAQGADATLWPQVGLSTTLTRMRLSEHGQFPPPLAGTTQNINEGNLAAAVWDLDFFGQHRATLNAALGAARAAEAEQQAARQLLASQIAQGYFELARLGAQHTLLQREQAVREAGQKLHADRYKAGLDARSEWESAQEQLAGVQRDQAALDGQMVLMRHALASLSGQIPQALDTLLPRLPQPSQPSQSRPSFATLLPSSLSAQLMGRRADVVAARWRVEAALQGLDAARALFYPDINLRAFVGYSSIGSLDHWLDAGNRQPGLGLALNLPLFDAGRLRAHYQAQTADTDAAISSYNATLLHALRDVADQQENLMALQRQLEHQQLALTRAQQGFDLAQQRYQSGVTGRLPVLRVESALIQQQRLMTDLQARAWAGQVQLIRALGGGYASTLPDTWGQQPISSAPSAPSAPTVPSASPPIPSIRPAPSAS